MRSSFLLFRSTNTMTFLYVQYVDTHLRIYVSRNWERWILCVPGKPYPSLLPHLDLLFHLRRVGKVHTGKQLAKRMSFFSASFCVFIITAFLFLFRWISCTEQIETWWRSHWGRTSFEKCKKPLVKLSFTYAFNLVYSAFNSILLYVVIIWNNKHRFIIYENGFLYYLCSR